MGYKIEVSTSPNYVDNAICPYFWIIRSIVENNDNSDWCTVTAGWAATPEEAWREAKDFYDEMIGRR